MERRTITCPVRLAAREADGENELQKIRGTIPYFDPDDPGTEFELWPGAVERIMPGAFARAAEEDDVVGLFNHDPNLVLGRTSAKTLRLTDHETGLDYEIDPPDTQVSRDLQESLRRGDVNGSSFAFIATDAQWVRSDGKDVREIRGVQLFDVSPVTYPAYSAASAGLRSAERERLKAEWQDWDAAERSAVQATVDADAAARERALHLARIA
jgi:HK97 family phage prohead protease